MLERVRSQTLGKRSRRPSTLRRKLGASRAASSQGCPLTGLIPTKMEGDARGGAAILMRAVTGVPVEFLGISEDVQAFEAFEPERPALRILGMADALTLIEQARETLDRQASLPPAAVGFAMEDSAARIGQVRRLGPMAKVLDLLRARTTGVARVDAQQAERRLLRRQAVVHSMTRQKAASP